MGTYRGHLKSGTRLGMMMLVNLRAGGSVHWQETRDRKERMPVAIIVGGPPVVGFQGPQKLRLNVNELGVAGGLAGGPINLVRGRTVDLLVPAEAEVVVEGYVDWECPRPEEATQIAGAAGQTDLVIEVSAITATTTRWCSTSIISQVTPKQINVVNGSPRHCSWFTCRHLGITGIQWPCMSR